jgi:hypothetical protein
MVSGGRQQKMEKYAESYTMMIFIGVVFFIYVIYLAYWPWFMPQEWRKRTRRHRGKIQRFWPFLPENVSYRFLKRHPDFDLWYARIGYLIMIVLAGGTIVIAYFSLRYVTGP